MPPLAAPLDRNIRKKSAQRKNCVSNLLKYTTDYYQNLGYNLKHDSRADVNHVCADVNHVWQRKDSGIV